MLRTIPNVHRQHRNADFTKVPTFTSKGKSLPKLVEHYQSYMANSNFFSNLALSSHSRCPEAVPRPEVGSTNAFASKTLPMLQHDARDTFGHIYGMKDPSNLAQPAVVNDKYDCTVFDNKELKADATLLSFTPQSYFFESIKEGQKELDGGSVKPFIRNLILHSEYDHESSLHNQLTQSLNHRPSGTLKAQALDTHLRNLDLAGSLPFYQSPPLNGY